MTLLQQAGAVVLLLAITQSLQCDGAAALIIWIRSIPRENHRVRVFRCAALGMQTTVAVIILYGIVILLWGVAIVGFAFRPGNPRSTFRRAAMRQLDTAMWSLCRNGACWARSKVWSAC